jgi:FkbM family methyltransferase
MKQLFKRVFNSFGYKVGKIQNNPLLDSDEPFECMKSLMGGADSGVFFDVGANVGQTVAELKSYFPNGRIYAFEPGTAYEQLSQTYQGEKNITTENIPLGSKKEELKFYVNSCSDMSSFLPLGKDGWGEIRQEVSLELKTLDEYCEEKRITKINILKSDTQGFDLQVLQGATNMLQATQFVFLEINFGEIYDGLPPFSEIFNFVSENGFKLVRFYGQQFNGNVLSHADILFINPNFK